MALHFVFLTLYNLASISKNVPELILESAIHIIMFLVKTNKIHPYVMFVWEDIKGEIWKWGGEIDQAEFFLKADYSSFTML